MSWILHAAAAALAGAALCASANAETRQLRIALQLPPASHLYENLDLFKTLVESGTNGALTIVIAHSGQLVKEQEAPAAVGSGIIEMSTASVVHYGKASPAVSLYVEPFMFSSPAVLAAATRPGSPLRSLVDQVILEKTAARVLWWQTAGSTIMVATGGPLTTPAAMKGMKVRANSESEAEFMRLCGGIPLVIPAAAQYDAYKTHQVSAGSTALHSIASRKLWEVARSASLTRHRTSEFVVTINEDLWQALPADHRRVIENGAREAEREMRSRMETLERETVTLAEKHHMKLVELTAEELKLWKDCATPMLEAYLQRSGDLGKQMMEAYRKVLVETYKTPALLGSQRRTVH